MPLLACMERGPGPAKYLLPGTCCKVSHDPSKKANPSFSFGTKPKSTSYVHSPGPVHYITPDITRHGKNGNPLFSFGRTIKPLAKYATPSPSAYHPENCPLTKTSRPPSFSFGIRTKYLKRSNVPSPNTYTLPSTIGSNIVGKKSAAAYSMTGRSAIGSFDQDFKKTPGPGTYKTTDSTVTTTRLPVYTLKGRTFPPLHSSDVPGPGKYYPEKVVVNKNINPSFTFGIKHTPYLINFVQMN